MKKIAIILIAVVAISLLGFFGWYLFSRDPDVPLQEAILDVLPFGSGDNTQITTDGEQPTTVIPEVDNEFASLTANLFRISNTPVAGAVVFKRNNQTVVRYADRATGHIYDVLLPTATNPSASGKTKVTNNTLPKIYEAYFRSDGNAVLLRSLENDTDVVSNLSLTLTPPLATTSDALYSVSSTALRGDISSVTAGSGNSLFYALRDTSTIVSSAFNGTGTRTLVNSPFTDWRLVSAGNSLLMFTKATSDAPGYAYNLNTANGALTKVVGPLNGLTAVPSAAGNRVIYSYVENGATRTFAKNITNSALTEILPTTLAEKCVWSVKQTGIVFCGAPVDDPGNGEPDNWYRGLTHFTDRIWYFDTITDIAQVIAEPKESLDVDLDVYEPKLSPDEDYLVFINKTDLSLWALKLPPF